MSAAGRSVVASAPALGAGDREFESPRPDHAAPCRAQPRAVSGPDVRMPSMPRGATAVKSAVETLNPTRVRLTVEVPFEELKPSLDAAYKKIARPGRRSPASARARCRRGSSTSAFGRGVGARGGGQRGAAAVLRRGRRENDVKVLGQPEVDVTELDDGAAPEVHRRGRRPARVRPAGRTTASRSPSTTPTSPTPTSTSSSTACASASPR